MWATLFRKPGGYGSVNITNGYGVIPPAILALIKLPSDILLQVDIHCARGVAYGPEIIILTKCRKQVVFVLLNLSFGQNYKCHHGKVLK